MIPPIDMEEIAFHAGMNEYGKNTTHVFICAACGNITCMDSPYYCGKCNRPICMECAMSGKDCEHRTRQGICQPLRMGKKKSKQLESLIDELISNKGKR